MGFGGPQLQLEPPQVIHDGAWEDIDFHTADSHTPVPDQHLNEASNPPSRQQTPSEARASTAAAGNGLPGVQMCCSRCVAADSSSLSTRVVLACITRDYTSLYHLDPASSVAQNSGFGRGECTWRIPTPPSTPHCAGLSRDSRFFAVGCADGRMRVYSCSSGALLLTTTAHTHRVCGLAWCPVALATEVTGHAGRDSPDGLVATFSDGSVRFQRLQVLDDGTVESELMCESFLAPSRPNRATEECNPPPIADAELHAMGRTCGVCDDVLELLTGGHSAASTPGSASENARSEFRNPKCVDWAPGTGSGVVCVAGDGEGVYAFDGLKLLERSAVSNATAQASTKAHYGLMEMESWVDALSFRPTHGQGEAVHVCVLDIKGVLGVFDAVECTCLTRLDTKLQGSLSSGCVWAAADTVCVGDGAGVVRCIRVGQLEASEQEEGSKGGELGESRPILAFGELGVGSTGLPLPAASSTLTRMKFRSIETHRLVGHGSVGECGLLLIDAPRGGIEARTQPQVLFTAGRDDRVLMWRLPGNHAPTGSTKPAPLALAQAFSLYTHERMHTHFFDFAQQREFSVAGGVDLAHFMPAEVAVSAPLLLTTRSGCGTVHAWDVNAAGSLVSVYTRHGAPITALCHTSDRACLRACGSCDSSDTSARCSPWIASGDTHGHVHIWFLQRQRRTNHGGQGQGERSTTSSAHTSMELELVVPVVVCEVHHHHAPIRSVTLVDVQPAMAGSQVQLRREASSTKKRSMKSTRVRGGKDSTSRLGPNSNRRGKAPSAGPSGGATGSATEAPSRIRSASARILNGALLSCDSASQVYVSHARSGAVLQEFRASSMHRAWVAAPTSSPLRARPGEVFCHSKDQSSFVSLVPGDPSVEVLCNTPQEHVVSAFAITQAHQDRSTAPTPQEESKADDNLLRTRTIRDSLPSSASSEARHGTGIVWCTTAGAVFWWTSAEGMVAIHDEATQRAEDTLRCGVAYDGQTGLVIAWGLRRVVVWQRRLGLSEGRGKDSQETAAEFHPLCDVATGDAIKGSPGYVASAAVVQNRVLVVMRSGWCYDLGVLLKPPSSAS